VKWEGEIAQPRPGDLQHNRLKRIRPIQFEVSSHLPIEDFLLHSLNE